jgi:hypothetical protein
MEITKGVKMHISSLFNREKRFVYIAKLFHYFPKMNDEKYLRKRWQTKFGVDLDLDNPQTFNEKLQWLKLYDRNPLYTVMVDKYAAKQYVSDIIGEQYIIPTLGVWESFDDIDFGQLPDQFVLKCTHDSHSLVICRDKSRLDLKDARNRLTKSLKRNYYYAGREWPYKDVKPQIIAEKYMEDSRSSDLCDYKFMCFHGKVKCTFVCTDRSSDLKVTFFDNNWQILPFERSHPASKSIINKPLNFELMIKLAETLSKDIPFLRVDFYEIDGKVYFGELTFYPGSGLESFQPSEWDTKLGQWIILPTERA